jgi:O-antigen/teichoic acid export membrane protein
VLTAAIVGRRYFPVRISMNLHRGWALLCGSRHFTAQQVIGAISANATQVLLPALAGPVSFGFFTAGALLAMRLAAIPEGLTTAFYPVLAGSYARSPHEAGRQNLRLMLLSIGICLPIAAGVTLVSSPVARWLFPSEPALCARVMQITIWSLPLLAIGGPMGYALNAAGRDATHARLSLIVAGLNLLLTVVLVLKWGLIGASWALPLRYIVLIALFAPCFVRSILEPAKELRLRGATAAA